jgi:hypothetical protein
MCHVYLLLIDLNVFQLTTWECRTIILNFSWTLTNRYKRVQLLIVIIIVIFAFSKSDIICQEQSSWILC